MASERFQTKTITLKSALHTKSRDVLVVVFYCICINKEFHKFKGCYLRCSLPPYPCASMNTLKDYFLKNADYRNCSVDSWFSIFPNLFPKVKLSRHLKLKCGNETTQISKSLQILFLTEPTNCATIGINPCYFNQ